MSSSLPHSSELQEVTRSCYTWFSGTAYATFILLSSLITKIKRRTIIGTNIYQNWANKELLK